ncbi:37S ribosomal protein S35 [Lachnellula suecica]|uniref:37S ribosomal protein S35 n=1 Tax=Lachnellula suecica TaxID=602035 RepID=A0A8T9C521_9HELO|nr:37S ribosomal protein S35 [Lachnellula suecica]
MPPTLRCASVIPSSSCTKHLCRAAAQSSRPFSTTPRHDQRATRARRALFRWLGSQGENFRNPLNGSTNYMGAYNREGQLKRVVESELFKARAREDKGQEPAKPEEAGKDDKNKTLPEETTRDRIPFPLNRNFVSQPVLSEELREEIWQRIMKGGKSVREVSADLKVEMSRVGAVVRLKEVEKEWKRILTFDVKGKPLARPYAQAVMSMLPKTPYDSESVVAHESINDLPVHASTGQQIFHPTSESRHFTRADAAKVFSKNLLPADDRIPHPELVIQHRERVVEELTIEQRQERALMRAEAADKITAAKAAKAAKKEAAIQKIDTGRWEFRFTPINSDDIGKDGRGHKGVGWRYGVPLYDRSRGQVKIPTSVE